MYNGLMRALQLMGLADAFGNSRLPLYVLNVTYPLVPEEVTRFCAGKRAVLMVEEGQPEFLEQAINAILRKADLQTRGARQGHAADGRANTPPPCLRVGPRSLRRPLSAQRCGPQHRSARADAAAGKLEKHVLPRPPSFCTGCPERPIFTAMKLVERELGPHHVSCDIGCHLFSILPPFNIGATTMGYGLGWAGAGGAEREGCEPPHHQRDGRWRLLAQRPGVLASATRCSTRPTTCSSWSITSTRPRPAGRTSSRRARQQPPQPPTTRSRAPVRGVGVKWVREVDAHLRPDAHARRAAGGADDEGEGAEGHRRVVGMHAQSPAPGTPAAGEGGEGRAARGSRTLRRRQRHLHRRSFLHPPVGLPVADGEAQPRPLRQDPVAAVQESCVGCGLCGEVAHAAVLCPSFYRAQIVTNPSRWDRLRARIADAVIGRFAHA